MADNAYDSLATALRRLLAADAGAASHDRRRILALLADALPEAERERRVLSWMIEHGMLEALARPQPGQLDLEIDRLKQRLENRLGIREELAVGVLRASAYALGTGVLPSAWGADAPAKTLRLEPSSKIEQSQPRPIPADHAVTPTRSGGRSWFGALFYLVLGGTLVLGVIVIVDAYRTELAQWLQRSSPPPDTYSKDAAQPLTSACTFNGARLAHGGAITAFRSEEVPPGETCASEIRHCANGSLSGSFTFAACRVIAAGPKGCSLDGVVVPHDRTITAYETLGSGRCVTEQRRCSDGTLSGSYPDARCRVTFKGCAFDGLVISHDQTVDAYETLASGRCFSEQRHCRDGVLSGSYPDARCRAR